MTSTFTGFTQKVFQLAVGAPLDTLVSIGVPLATLNYTCDPFTSFTAYLIDQSGTQINTWVLQHIYSPIAVNGTLQVASLPVINFNAPVMPASDITLTLQVQQFDLSGAVVVFQQSFTIVAVQPYSVLVTIDGNPVSGASVVLIPKDPLHAFDNSRPTTLIATDSTGTAVFAPADLTTGDFDQGALVTAYDASGDFFGYLDNVTISDGTVTHIPLLAYGGGPAPAFTVTVHNNNPIGATLEEIATAIQAAGITGFKLNGVMVSGSTLTYSVSPLPMSPEFDWGEMVAPGFLKVVIVLITVAIVVSVVGWTFEGAANAAKPFATAINAVGVAVAVALIGGAGLVVYSYATDSGGRASVRSASGRAGRSVLNRARRYFP